ncbi:lanthionine synthetase LanC family protein [Streptomyces sp. NPDC048172]|uniref:lanthionine synthetase LanC family protein n=1 Tax=Streptomyces sp. NPDC048172 TaxID=3365505 RepID=UPI00371ED517
MTETTSTEEAATDAVIRAQALRLATDLLTRWSERAPGPHGTGTAADDTPPGDPAVPVLAALLAETGEPSAVAAASRATVVWARGAGRGGGGQRGLYGGGLAGTLVGLRHAAAVHPELHAVADRLRDRLLGDDAPGGPAPHGQVPHGQAPYGQVTFADYDLVLGPSGVLLALTAGLDSAAPSVDLAPYADRLATLCDAPELDGLRARYAGHELLDWMDGRVNTGMGHGVAGVTVALTAAVRHLGTRPEWVNALRNAVRWLTAQAFTDARGVRTWDGAGLDGLAPPPGARTRQAWCYGTPGVAWALWDAADALGDAATAAWADEAFTTLAGGYDEEFHLFGDHPGDRLGLCHGASGVLAVADAFHRHAAPHPAASLLRTRLLRHLSAREDELCELSASRTGLLGGAGGALSAVLTATGGTRGWLPCLGLR